MNKRTQSLLITLLRPIYAVLVAVFNFVDKVLLGWLHWWMQRRANDRLAEEVLASLYFLEPDVVRVKEPTTVLPFDYAIARVMYGNICFTVARGRGDTTVSVSPRHNIKGAHELGFVISTLESRRLRASDMVWTLPAAVDLIRPRIQALNDAFSESRYSELRARL